MQTGAFEPAPSPGNHTQVRTLRSRLLRICGCVTAIVAFGVIAISALQRVWPGLLPSAYRVASELGGLTLAIGLLALSIGMDAFERWNTRPRSSPLLSALVFIAPALVCLGLLVGQAVVAPSANVRAIILYPALASGVLNTTVLALEPWRWASRRRPSR